MSTSRLIPGTSEVRARRTVTGTLDTAAPYRCRAGAVPTDILFAVPAPSQIPPVVRRVPVANLANALTALRLVLVPVFLLFLFAGDGHQTASRITAFVVFAAAVRLIAMTRRNRRQPALGAS